MIFPLRLSNILSLVVMTICLMFVSSATTVAQIPSITVKVADTTAMPNSLNTPVTIFMDNLFDDVAGLNLWIQLDRPDVMIFQTDTLTVFDTTFWVCNDTNVSGACIDSIEVFSWETYEFFYDTVFVATLGSFDTTGTLMSGWEFVDTRSLSGIGTDINIVGIADLPGGSVVPPISAGQQGGVLIRILADVFPMDDANTDRTVNMLVQKDFKDHFSFSRPDGSSINWIPLEILDTTCYECTNWVGEVCLGGWQKVPKIIGVPLDTLDCLDSMAIYLDTIAVLDSANINIINGSLTVTVPPLFVCGNVDGSPDGLIDIADLVHLVNYMFGIPTGPEPIPIEAGDVDCALGIDIADLVYLVNYMFGIPTGPVPCAGC